MQNDEESFGAETELSSRLLKAMFSGQEEGTESIRESEICR